MDIIYESCYGNLDEVKRLIAEGFDVNTTYENINDIIHEGGTALTHASEFGRLEVVRYLVSVGADIEDSDYDGRTSLMKAARNNHHEIVSFLIDAGVDICSEDGRGNKAIHFCGGLEALKVLIDAGADIDAIGSDNKTLLQTLKEHRMYRDAREDINSIVSIDAMIKFLIEDCGAKDL